MKTRKLSILALPLVALTLSATAHAQQFNNRQNNNQQNNQRTNQQTNANNGGLLPLPPGIANIIAVDAQNSLLAETDGENGVPRQFFGITVRHVYAGGIARLFGGEVIPTAPFVSPYFNGNNGFGNNNNNNNGGFNNANNGNNNFNNGGFNNANNGNNNFGNNGNNNFNGGNTFNNGNVQR